MRRRTGLLFVSVVLGHLVLISAQVNARSGETVLKTMTFGAFAEVQRTSARAIGLVSGAWTRYVALTGTDAENARLRAEVAALEIRLQEQRALALRGERLELLLELKQAVPYRTLAADVIAGDASAWFRMVTINRGTADGLRRDLAVIAPGGVAGRILGDPRARAARVQLLIDRSAGAGALIERSRAGGVVIGDGSGLHMEYVSTLADVVVGDIVVTSGLDGIYPKGFVIGEVVSVERGSGVYKSIAVRPSVDFSALEEVLVVLDEAAEAAEAVG
jgi:rod shape-determining protein MreC